MRLVQTEPEPLANEPLISDLVDAMDRAVEAKQRYAVIVVYPQRMVAEDVRDIIDASEPALRDVLRDDDISGRVADDVLVVGLTGLSPDNVRALTYRLKGDLRLRTAHIRQSVWETGYASMPEDGASLEELLATAVRNAKNARLHL